MVLIISQESDASTCDVIDWIDYLGEKFCRISDQDWQYNFSLHLSDTTTNIELRDFNIEEKEISAVWLRRYGPKTQPNLSHISDSYEFKKDLEEQLWNESKKLRNGFFKALKDKPWLSSFDTISPNKIDILLLAKQAGLSIPATCITSSKSEILKFLNQYGRAITKSISDSEIFKYNSVAYMQYTKEVTADLLENYNEKIYACLLQEMIEKEVEIRTFYLHRKCYSMAIFSQLDEQTSIDFRKYNKEIPNRTVPFQLPTDIEEKIQTFMQLANLDTGSLDIILSKDGRYVFLEVNPVGQYGMTSIPCNYFLDREIAQWLINPTNQKS